MNDTFYLIQFLGLIYFLMFILNAIMILLKFCFDKMYRKQIRETSKKEMLIYFFLLVEVREMYNEGSKES